MTDFSDLGFGNGPASPKLGNGSGKSVNMKSGSWSRMGWGAYLSRSLMFATATELRGCRSALGRGMGANPAMFGGSRIYIMLQEPARIKRRKHAYTI
jgi:hypothetical protein